MKRIMLVTCVGALLIAPGLLQAQSFSVDCDTGASFDNGVEIIVNQMRAGFTYTATAIGIGGFDPVLAVVGENGDGLCNDDDAIGADYHADLPTTGTVRASNLSSQVTFSHDDNSGFQDISLVVGGFNNAVGEVLVVLEGMAVTNEDGDGDPFSVNITPEMVGSGLPLTTYAITRGDGSVDPLILLSDGEGGVLQDNDGNDIFCDDAGNPDLCWGDSVDLSDYSVSIDTGTLPGWQYDAMLVTPIDGLELDSDRSNNYLTYLVTSYQNQTEGQYLLAFHFGIGEAVSTGTGK